MYVSGWEGGGDSSGAHLTPIPYTTRQNIQHVECGRHMKKKKKILKVKKN